MSLQRSRLFLAYQTFRPAVVLPFAAVYRWALVTSLKRQWASLDTALAVGVDRSNSNICDDSFHQLCVRSRASKDC